MHGIDGLALNDGFAAENQYVPTPYFTVPALSLVLFVSGTISLSETITVFDVASSSFGMSISTSSTLAQTQEHTVR